MPSARTAYANGFTTVKISEADGAGDGKNEYSEALTPAKYAESGAEWVGHKAQNQQPGWGFSSPLALEFPQGARLCPAGLVWGVRANFPATCPCVVLRVTPEIIPKSKGKNPPREVQSL